MRYALKKHDWGVETYQRTHSDDTAARQPNEFVEMRWESARLLRDGLMAEQLRRRLQDTDPHRIDDGLTDWIAPSAALVDPATPTDLREALERQRAHVARAVDARGTVAQREAWAANKPGHISQEEWVRNIGQASAWRDAHKATPTTLTRDITDAKSAEEGMRRILEDTGASQARTHTMRERQVEARERLERARARLERSRSARNTAQPTPPPRPPRPEGPAPRGPSLH